jgi:hypothetical protein
MTFPRESDALVPREASEIVRFRRDDLAALSAMSLQSRGSGWRSIVPVASGGLTFFTLIGLQEGLGWSTITTPLCVGAAVAVCAIATLWLWRTERARRAAYVFDCPQCGLSIVSGAPGTDDGPRASLVIATGCCPGCGARIVAD